MLTRTPVNAFGDRFELETGMEAENTSYPWYALLVRTRYENMVGSHLHARGYEWLLPLSKCRRRWSDRFKEIEVPLFPGYVFCRFNVMNRLPILTIPGVVHVVGVGKIPVPIDEGEIAAIKAAVKSGLPSQPCPFLQIGQRVRIEYGPLCGVEGLLLDFKGHRRLILSITLLKRSVSVEVEEAWVSSIHQEHWPRTSPVTSQDQGAKVSLAAQASG